MQPLSIHFPPAHLWQALGGDREYKTVPAQSPIVQTGDAGVWREPEEGFLSHPGHTEGFQKEDSGLHGEEWVGGS